MTSPKVTPGGPFGSFIRAMRSRRPEDINCDAVEGHYSSALCHLANISYLLGESVPFNQPNSVLGNHERVAEAFANVEENLRAVGLNLDATTYQLGRELTFDPTTETFAGDDQANALLRRVYREPFVVPETV